LEAVEICSLIAVSGRWLISRRPNKGVREELQIVDLNSRNKDYQT
jgi:hypothetical protein